MADIFISYSRQDKNFVKKIHDKLTEYNFKCWIDLEDIPLTSQWILEIYKGIESSNYFIFVISQFSIASETCLKEIEHAIKYDKRIIPLVLDDVEYKDVASAIASLQWIPFQKEKDFDESFGALLSAIKTDLNWVHEHTRILTRAIDWEKKQYDKSLLLRGRELKSAETWLSNTDPQTSTKPAQLHTQFILRSRQTANTRQRIILAIVLTGFLIASVLAFIAFKQYTVAESRRKNIAEQNIETEARLLTAQSSLILSQQKNLIDRSMLLAVEAMKRLKTIEGWNLLQKGLDLLPEAYNIDHRYAVCGAEYSPTGKYLATGCYDGYLRVWETDTKELILKEKHQYPVWQVKFDPSEQFIATASWDESESSYPMLKIWNLATGEQTANIVHEMGFYSIKMVFSPNGKYIASGFSPIGRHGSPTISSFARNVENFLRIWSCETGKLAYRINYTNFIQEFQFDPAGQYLFTFYEDTIKTWDPATGNRTHFFTITNKDEQEVGISCFNIDASGTYLAIGRDDGIVSILNMFNPKETFHLQQDENVKFTSVLFSPKLKYLATADYNSCIWIWELNSLRLMGKLNHEDLINQMVFNPDCRYIASASQDKTARVWNVSTAEELARIPHEKSVQTVNFHPQGAKIITASYDGTARECWSTSNSWKTVRMKHNKPVNNLTFSSDGELLATYEDSVAYLWNLQNGEKVFSISENLGASISTLSFAHNKNLLGIATTRGIIEIYDLDNETKIFKNQTKKSVFFVCIMPNQKNIIAACNDFTIKWFDIESGEEIKNLQLEHPSGVDNSFNKYYPFHGITQKQFSPSLQYLATSIDSSVIVWEINTGKQISLLKHNLGVSSFVFHPADTLIATILRPGIYSQINNNIYKSEVKTDFNIRIWNIKTGMQIFCLKHEKDINSLAFSSNGKYLVSGSDDKASRIWNVQTGCELKKFRNDCAIKKVLFSPDDSCLAVVNDENLLTIRNLKSDQEIARMANMEDIRYISFSPKGRYLALTGSNASVRIFNWQPKDLISEIKNRLTRNLTFEEWREYFPNELYRKTCDNLPVDPGFIQHGAELVLNGDIKQGLSILKQAVALDTSIHFHPTRHTLDLMAYSAINKNDNIVINEDSLRSYASNFKKLLKSESASDFDLKDEIRDVLSTAMISKAEKCAINGRLPDALSVIKQAKLFNEKLVLSENSYEIFCWYGSVYEFTEETLELCTKAVKLYPDNGLFLYSRGIARVLSDEFKGAADDFQKYIKWTDSKIKKEQLTSWIEALNNGKNPITFDVLQELRETN